MWWARYIFKDFNGPKDLPAIMVWPLRRDLVVTVAKPRVVVVVRRTDSPAIDSLPCSDEEKATLRMASLESDAFAEEVDLVGSILRDPNEVCWNCVTNEFLDIEFQQAGFTREFMLLVSELTKNYKVMWFSWYESEQGVLINMDGQEVRHPTFFLAALARKMNRWWYAITQ